MSNTIEMQVAKQYATQTGELCGNLRIRGLYFGKIPFTGTVTDVRSVGRVAYQVDVKLDKPIAVYGETRSQIGWREKSQDNRTTWEII
jgi:hypothetical protein